MFSASSYYMALVSFVLVTLIWSVWKRGLQSRPEKLNSILCP
jgi:hypothetical protein